MTDDARTIASAWPCTEELSGACRHAQTCMDDGLFVCDVMIQLHALLASLHDVSDPP
jgi:hypothetical protein